MRWSLLVPLFFYLTGCSVAPKSGRPSVKFSCDDGAVLFIEEQVEIVRTGSFVLNLSVFESAEAVQEFLHSHHGEMMSVMVDDVTVCKQKVGYVYRRAGVHRINLVLVPDDVNLTESILLKRGIRVYKYGETGLVVPAGQLE